MKTSAKYFGLVDGP